MSGFLEVGSWGHRLRDIILIALSLIAFTLAWFVKDGTQIENSNIKFFFASASIFFLFVFALSSIELASFSKTFDESIYIFCLFIFGMSVIIAAILQDVNVIVASSTLLLVIISAFTIKKTTDISLKQLALSLKQIKLQNDPLMSISLKENDSRENVIDLVIENAGNGLAKNISFEIQPHGFETLSGDHLEQLYFFQRGIQLLPSKQKYVIHLVNFAVKIANIRLRHCFPMDDAQLSPSEAQRFRQIVRDESELQITVHYENNEGERIDSIFNFNLCIFWGLR